MPLYRAFLQTLGATLLLALALACHGKHNGASSSANAGATITGTITYARVPLATDANGVPTGLVDATVATNLKSLPARGTTVRAYQQIDQTQPDGTIKPIWIMAKSTITDASGNYSISIAKDRPTMVEVLSTFDGGGGTFVNVVAESGGINSTTDVLNRVRYAYRKAATDSTASGSMTVSPYTPKWTLSANAVVDFSIGLNDEWLLVDPSYTPVSSYAPFVEQAIRETTLPGRGAGLGSGSRILGIGDSTATFLAAYGTATPGTTLDLHYWPSRSEARGSFIEFDRTLFPQSYDRSTGVYHFFGSLRGDAANDDAWDEGVILPLLARGVLYAGSAGRTFSVPLNPLFPIGTALKDLTPDMARIEGLADAMATNLLKSPYLADTNGTALAAPVRDIRDISSLSATQKTPYSAPALRALAWEIILKSNSLPSPGIASDWAKIDPLATARFFAAPAGQTNGATDATARDIEPINIFTQLGRLKEGKTGTDTVDLAAIFTDAVTTNLCAPFGITWPRPTTGTYASFTSDWGVNPVNPFPSVTLSMAKAVQVYMPYTSAPNVIGYQLQYPNLSQGEVFFAGFSLSTDKRCVLTATVSPALAGGSQIDVDLPKMLRTFSFTGSGGTTDAMVIPGNATTPLYYPVRIWLKNPSAIQADVTVTLTLTPAP